jgi:transposase-like protein
MLDAAFKLVREKTVLDNAKGIGNVASACRDLSVSRSSFYRWRAAYEAHGEAGLYNRSPVGKKWPNQPADDVVERIPHLRRRYHMGPQRAIKSGGSGIR